MALVRHIPGGQLEDVSREEALRLLRLGLVEMAGGLEMIESAMVEPPENAMLPAAKPKRRRVRRG